MNKGMSQTLALIVAASVLMMTALTVIFMTQGSLQDVFSGSNRQSCVSTITSKCSVASGQTSFQAPASCERAGLLGQTVNGHQIGPSGQVTCSKQR
ncbi:MAG: hypothetical protein ABEJ07_01890 [Candidatus Nanohaloarchaea archaeon]